MKYRCRFRYVFEHKEMNDSSLPFRRDVVYYNDNEYIPRKNTRNDDVSTQNFRSRTRCRCLSEISTSLVSQFPDESAKCKVLG